MTEDDKHNELQAIVASVGYLINESDKAGFYQISMILKKALADMEKALLGEKLDGANYLPHIINSQLYKIILLLLEFAGLNKFDLQSIMRSIEHYNDIKQTAH